MSSAFQVNDLLIKISRIFAILLMKMPSLLMREKTSKILAYEQGDCYPVNSFI